MFQKTRILSASKAHNPVGIHIYFNIIPAPFPAISAVQLRKVFK
jgi:hypothetical protein